MGGNCQMDNIETYRPYIKQLIAEYGKYKPSYGDIDMELICICGIVWPRTVP